MADVWYQSAAIVYPLLAAAGFVAGVVNTMAGGGSFVSLSALMFLAGLDPKTANATNRLGVVLSSGVSATVFHRHGYLDRSAAARVGLPTLLGAPVGVLLAAYLPLGAFQAVFGGLFLAMAAFLVARPATLLSPGRPRVRSRAAEAVLFFGIGVYSGFIQAGMGILLLVGMSLFHGRELIGANAIKNLVAFLVVLLALVMFVFLGDVRWLPGLVMMAGNLAGGVVGARLAIRRGQKLVLALVIVVMVATGVKLLWGVVA